jgi:serine/threonine protein kinase
MILKSMSLSDSVKNNEVEKEIEKEVNLCHPCILDRIGFVFRVESSELRELKIGRLFVESCSLAEVILVNPVWWTPTVKAKAVAGIALGLRFAHSLGIIHGNLNSSNILFNVDHRIQITNFGQIHLEVHESESATEVGLHGIFGEGWTPQTDVRAFGSLLFEMIVGHASILFCGGNNEGNISVEIAQFVSEMIEAIGSRDSEGVNSMNTIVDILKRNDFKIESDVNSTEVWEFVRWVERWEQYCE